MVGLLAVLGPALAFAQAPDKGDTAWMLTSTALVLFMTILGLSLFYGGLVRTRNVLSVLMQCFSITCVASLVWLVVGYSLAFTESNGFIGSLDKVDAYVDNALSQKQKIMGIGHRVYKTLDPRAPHLRDMAKKLSAKIGESKWIDMSDRIAKLMLEKKGLNANVDFYSATMYYSLGIPTDLFTPIFAISRTAGWTAHVLEQLSDNRLIRPQSVYTGPVGLKVKPVDQR